MPKLLVFAGLVCLTCVGLGIAGQSGIGDDKKEDTETVKAETKPASKGDAKTPVAATPSAATEVVKEALPEVTFLPSESAGETDAAAILPVQEAIKAFAHAFNAHDAKAVTAMFLPQAELTNLAGQVTRGSAAIQNTFGNLFTEQPTVKIQFAVNSIRFLSADLAIEDGISTMAADAGAAHQDHYTVTHARQDGKWLIASARDWPSPRPTREQELKQLEWLIGDWVDENGDTLVATTYRWSEDKNYILSDYSIQRQGQAPRKGTQRIAWDPQAQKLHSWNFDTAGGFSEGLWTRTENQWIIKISGVSADGQSRSSTSILTRLSQDHATRQSRDRITGGELLPDHDALPIVRRPPEPTRAAK